MKTPFIWNRRALGAKRTSLRLACTLAIALLNHRATAQVANVDLGSASDFAVLAGAGVTNAGATNITGNVGSTPTATTAGFGTVILVGTNHGGDATTVDAKDALDTAYTDAAGRTATTTYGAIFDLQGLTLTTGVYNDPSSFSINGVLTLDAQGDPNAVWIFQMGSTLSTGADSEIVLTDGAQASNVFWQVGSSATFGADTQFAGNVLAFTSITMGDGSTVAGSLLAENGAVSLTNNIVSVVPEPSPLPILGFGLLGLALLRRRFWLSEAFPQRVWINKAPTTSITAQVTP